MPEGGGRPDTIRANGGDVHVCRLPAGDPGIIHQCDQCGATYRRTLCAPPELAAMPQPLMLLWIRT